MRMDIRRDGYTAIDIANYIIYRINDINPEYGINRLQLQLLTFFCYVHYYQENSSILFDEEIYKWQHGPTVLSIFHSFKGFIGEVDIVPQFLLLENGFSNIFFDLDHYNAQDKELMNFVIDATYLSDTKEMVLATLSDISYHGQILDILNGMRDYTYTLEEIQNFGKKQYNYEAMVNNYSLQIH